MQKEDLYAAAFRIYHFIVLFLILTGSVMHFTHHVATPHFNNGTRPVTVVIEGGHLVFLGGLLLLAGLLTRRQGVKKH